MLKIPNDFVLMLSGVSCVGKTTVAYNLLHNMPQFRIVTQLDIVRTAIRSVIKKISYSNNKDNANKIYIDFFKPIFDSITNGDYATLKQQSNIMMNCLQEIIKRQQMRQIPTIIEGINIIPSLYFINDKPIEGFNRNVAFIDLYISDIADHRKRRQKRCKERGYAQINYIMDEKVDKQRNINLMLYEETVNLSKKHKNVFALDVSNKSEEAVVLEIYKCLLQLYPS